MNCGHCLRHSLLVLLGTSLPLPALATELVSELLQLPLIRLVVLIFPAMQRADLPVRFHPATTLLDLGWLPIARRRPSVMVTVSASIVMSVTAVLSGRRGSTSPRSYS